MDAFGNCPRALRHCPKCPRLEGAMGRISDNGNSSIGKYPWMETAECGQCSTKWYICTLCTALRVHIRGLTNLRAHYTFCHKEDRRPPKKRVVYMQPYQELKVFGTKSFRTKRQINGSDTGIWYSFSFTASSFSH
jgi:hypothetical protein